MDVIKPDQIDIVQAEDPNDGTTGWAIGFWIEGEFEAVFVVKTLDDMGIFVHHLVGKYGSLKDAHKDQVTKQIDIAEQIIKGDYRNASEL